MRHFETEIRMQNVNLEKTFENGGLIRFKTEKLATNQAKTNQQRLRSNYLKNIRGGAR